MYNSNPHRAWHHCRVEIETTTQFSLHPQWGFNKLPEDAFQPHSLRDIKCQLHCCWEAWRIHPAASASAEDGVHFLLYISAK